MPEKATDEGAAAALKLNAAMVLRRVDRTDCATVLVHRPVWRSFRPAYVDRAAAHVRRGGFAAILDDRGGVKVLLPRDTNGALTEMSLWALLAIDLRRWGSARSGPCSGLATVRLKKPGDKDIIAEWCERDCTMPEATHEMRLDCRACGACCRDNRVVLESHDLARWRRAKREDLCGKAFVRTSRATQLLRLNARGRCVHLAPGNRCRIYPLRPLNCSAFPAGSEPCLCARQETLGVTD